MILSAFYPSLESGKYSQQTESQTFLTATSKHVVTQHLIRPLDLIVVKNDTSQNITEF